MEPVLDTWGIVELMGHRKMAGKLSEASIAGAGFIRVDVPEVQGWDGEQNPAYTKYLGPASIYAITPTDEETARAAAARLRALPVDGVPYFIRPALPAPMVDVDDPIEAGVARLDAGLALPREDDVPVTSNTGCPPGCLCLFCEPL